MQPQAILLPSSQRKLGPILIFADATLAKGKMDASLRWHDEQKPEAA